MVRGTKGVPVFDYIGSVIAAKLQSSNTLGLNPVKRRAKGTECSEIAMRLKSVSFSAALSAALPPLRILFVIGTRRICQNSVSYIGHSKR